MPRVVKDGPVRCTWTPDAERRAAMTDPHNHLTPQRPKILPDMTYHVGNTPLVRLNRIPQSLGLKCEVLVKCEFFNAGGSVKDRIGVRMVNEAERVGRIKPGDTLIEPTSGNTGIGLSLAAAVKGYKMIITLPEKMSKEKVDVLKGLGAEIIRTPTEAASDAPESHLSVAKRLEKELPNAHILDQYNNPDNPLAHYDGTALEIIDACEGKLDGFIAGAGTGGTLTGTARRLVEEIPGIKIIGVDPLGSDLAYPDNMNTPAPPNLVEGIGYDFIPVACDRDPHLVHKWVKSDDKESFIMARRLIREEGILCGGSSGSAVHYGLHALLEDEDLNQEGKRVVIILPDSVRNYMTKFLSDDWMIENKFVEAGSDGQTKEREAEWGSGTVADLNPPAVVTVAKGSSIADAIATMEKDGFDNVPVVTDGGRMVGLLTIGELLARIARGDATKADTVEKAMFHFDGKQKFQPVTKDTKLSDLQNFFNDHAVAFVTDAADSMKVEAVISKVDVLKFLVK